ncbi:photosynthetic complex putative assembly protein PuhB [Halomonas denitrificans]|nr:PH domain-containing protein [Halomonas denitrificans]
MSHEASDASGNAPGGIRVRPIKPLPGPLPEGERVLWQQVPEWKAYGRRVFQLGKIALYFLVIIAWVAASAYFDTGEAVAVARALVWAVPPALGVLALLAAFAWLYARTTVFTVTDKRVIIQSGLALPSAVNLPFVNVARADLACFDDGTGDIELPMNGPRLLYSMVWPNVRLFRLKRPVPVLRALENPRQAGEILGRALAAHQQAADTPAAAAAPFKPDLRRTAAS